MLPDIYGEYYADIEDDIEDDFEEESLPNKTYKLDFENNRIIGTTDEMDALKQAIQKILMTELGEDLIYDDNYGLEKNDLYGADIDWIQSELEDRVTEAILADDRFESVYDFEVEQIKNKLSVSFIAKTVEENEIEIEEGVTINV